MDRTRIWLRAVMYSTGYPSRHQRIIFRIAALVCRSLLALAPVYLRDLCLLSHLWYQRSQLPQLNGTGAVLCVHVARNSTRQTLALSVVGPSVWNRLQLAPRLFPMILSDTFYSSLKTALLAIQG